MNLWSEFDNLLDASPSARPGRMRRLTEQVVLSATRDWLLQDYVSAYCHFLAGRRIYRRCYWIDAWGGDMRVRREASSVPESATRKGKKASALPDSPLLQPLLSLAQRLSEESMPITLRGLVLDAGSSRRREKRIRTNSDPHGEGLILPRESGILPGNWLDIAPHLLKEIEQSPAIFLLNPFGQLLFSHEALAPLYQRTTAPTELLLLLNHRQMEIHLREALQKPESAALLTGLLRSSQWKKIVQTADKSATPIDIAAICELLIAAIQRHMPFVQAISLPVQIQPALIEIAPYTLLFATRSKESLSAMNDAVCRYSRMLYERSHQGVLGEEWFREQQRRRTSEIREQITRHILQQGKSQRIRRWPDLRHQVFLSYFGQFLQSEYDEIMRMLLEKGEVRCQWRRSPAVEAIERTPGNDDTLLWL